MANDPRTEQGKAFALDADSRTTWWIVLASVAGVGALLSGGFFGILLLGGAVYSGLKAYQAKKDARAAIMNITAPPVPRSSAEAALQQQLAPEPQQPAETKWQATVSKSSSPTPGAGRGA